MNPRLVLAPLSIVYGEASNDVKGYEREYHQLRELDDNPVNSLVKHAKSRADATEMELILINLIVDLHNKIDALEMFLKNEKPKRVFVPYASEIDSIGYEYFNISEESLSVGVEYYGRIVMPIYPKREIGIFFQAQTPTLALITRIHERDEKEWSSYIRARERVLIREAKENIK